MRISDWSSDVCSSDLVGAISLLMALYALQVLPVNYAGVALIALGVVLMAVELAMPSFGALGIGGLAALVAGSLIMFDTDRPGSGVRSEERRVGEEWVSKCIYWWSPYT